MLRRLFSAGLTRGGRAESGTAVVELVVMLPFLLILLFGIADVGRALWYHHIITKGVRDGVRYLSRMPLTEPYLTNARRVAITGSPTGTDAFSFWNDPGTIDVTTRTVAHAGEFRDPGPVTVVQMTATVPVDFWLLAFTQVLLDAETLADRDPELTFTVFDEARHIGE